MRALARWARLKQNQGVRVTQQMIRDEAAFLSTVNVHQYTTESSTTMYPGQVQSPAWLDKSTVWPTSSPVTAGLQIPGRDTFAPHPTEVDAARQSWSNSASHDSVGSASSDWYPGALDTMGPTTLRAPVSAVDRVGTGQEEDARFVFPNDMIEAATYSRRSEQASLSDLEELSEFLSTRRPVSSFDCLCVEHLRERIMQTRAPSAAENELDTRETLPSLAAVMQAQNEWT